MRQSLRQVHLCKILKSLENPVFSRLFVAPRAWLEQATSWLTVMRSTDWANEEYVEFWRDFKLLYPFADLHCMCSYGLEPTVNRLWLFFYTAFFTSIMSVFRWFYGLCESDGNHLSPLFSPRTRTCMSENMSVKNIKKHSRTNDHLKTAHRLIYIWYYNFNIVIIIQS